VHLEFVQELLKKWISQCRADARLKKCCERVLEIDGSLYGGYRSRVAQIGNKPGTYVEHRRQTIETVLDLVKAIA